MKDQWDILDVHEVSLHPLPPGGAVKVLADSL